MVELSHKEKVKKYNHAYYNSLSGYLRNIFSAMCNRCNNPNNKRYKYYGARGIKVKFASFDEFYNYVIYELKAKPRGLTIDRIDNDDHYEKGNIRFVTRAENNRTRRKSNQHLKDVKQDPEFAFRRTNASCIAKYGHSRKALKEAEKI